MTQQGGAGTHIVDLGVNYPFKVSKSVHPSFCTVKLKLLNEYLNLVFSLPAAACSPCLDMS